MPRAEQGPCSTKVGQVRVGVIGPLSPDSFADNILDCLPDVGAEAVSLGPARRRTGQRHVDAVVERYVPQSQSLDVLSQRGLADRAVEAECDLVINVVGALRPETVSRIRASGTKVALWYPDHIANIGNQLMFTAPYSRLYFKDPYLVDWLVRLEGLPGAYLPEACNPRWHRPVGEPAAEVGFVSVGNMYPSRVLLFDRLLADSVPLRLYGSGFPRWLAERPLMEHHTGRFVMREDKARAFRQSSGVVNNLHPAERGVNCRMFEAAGSGAAVVCEARDTLPSLFEVGSEVLAFQDYDELVMQCKRLQEDPDLTRRVGDAATSRAHAEHTYQHRLRVILEDLG